MSRYERSIEISWFCKRATRWLVAWRPFRELVRSEQPPRQGHAAFCVAAGEKAGAGRDRRHGQQDGADRLGADDARRNISRSTYPDTGCVGDNRFSRATLAA